MGALAKRGWNDLVAPVYSARMRPNPPRMVTVVVAVLLLLVGLALIYLQADVVRLARQLPLGGDSGQILDWIRNKTVAYLFLAASPLLLIVGSLFKGI